LKRRLLNRGIGIESAHCSPAGACASANSNLFQSLHGRSRAPCGDGFIGRRKSCACFAQPGRQTEPNHSCAKTLDFQISAAQALDLQCKARLAGPETGEWLFIKRSDPQGIVQIGSIGAPLRTKGACGLLPIVDLERQSHTEPPSGRISVFEKGRLVSSFES